MYFAPTLLYTHTVHTELINLFPKVTPANLMRALIQGETSSKSSSSSPC